MGVARVDDFVDALEVRNIEIRNKVVRENTITDFINEAWHIAGCGDKDIYAMDLIMRVAKNLRERED